ncbi:PEP-CTERM sorting domain-containing protein [Tautonia sp. JC769]|uniref:PEP-CTERM sorting domain-containing protein n=1 Tax=Tautonia sp. JC769 TaxID=3232135 RepID=UPI003457A4E2
MTQRFTFLAALTLVASFASSAMGQGAATIGFAGFSQSAGTSAIDYSRSAGANPLPATLTASTEVNFTINNPIFMIDPMGPTNYTGASFTLSAESSTAATANGQSGFFGSFSIIGSGGENLLSGTFDSATLSQVGTGRAAFDTGSVDFTSDIFVPTFNDELVFSIIGGFTNLAVNNGAFQNFSADRLSGDFSAIPEPATLAMAGLGIFALPLAVRAARRRRSVSSN